MKFMNGSVRNYHQIEIEDAQFIFEIYGDETICDGDKKEAVQYIHLDADFETVRKCNS